MPKPQVRPGWHSESFTHGPTPLPQGTPAQPVAQSLSLGVVQPLGQQSSLLTQLVIGLKLQVALQVAGDPESTSVVQVLLSRHSDGHLPSQISPGLVTLS